MRRLAELLQRRVVFAWADVTDWLMPWRPQGRELAALLREHHSLRAVVRRQGRTIINMEDRMSEFEAAAADLAELTDAMADKLEASEATNAELLKAIAEDDQERIAALAEQSARHTAVVKEISNRLRGIGADPVNPVPDTTPLPEPEAPQVDENGTGGGDVVEPGTDTEVTPDAPVVDAPVVDGGSTDEVSTGGDAPIASPDAQQS